MYLDNQLYLGDPSAHEYSYANCWSKNPKSCAVPYKYGRSKHAIVGWYQRPFNWNELTVAWTCSGVRAKKATLIPAEECLMLTHCMEVSLGLGKCHANGLTLRPKWKVKVQAGLPMNPLDYDGSMHLSHKWGKMPLLTCEGFCGH